VPFASVLAPVAILGRKAGQRTASEHCHGSNASDLSKDEHHEHWSIAIKSYYQRSLLLLMRCKDYNTQSISKLPEVSKLHQAQNLSSIDATYSGPFCIGTCQYGPLPENQRHK